MLALAMILSGCRREVGDTVRGNRTDGDQPRTAKSQGVFSGEDEATANSAQADEYSGLRAGFALSEITPGRDVSLMGYGFRAPGNDGVHEPLNARVLALQDGAKPCVLVSLDLCVIPSETARKMRAGIARQADTDVA
jgi:hypothetical protein